MGPTDQENDSQPLSDLHFDIGNVRPFFCASLRNSITHFHFHFILINKA